MGGYLGKSVGGFTSVTEKRQTFNITTTTTQLTGLSYTPTKEEVHVNGIRYVRDVDYTANDGLTITMTNPLLNGDTAIVKSFPSFDVADTVSASNGGTFAGNVAMSGTLGVTGATTLSDDLVVDTNTLFVDASANKVGIGTATPAKPLSVVKANGGNFIAEFQNTTDATPYGIHVKDAASGANGYPLFQVTNGAGNSTYFRADSGTGYVIMPKIPAFNQAGYKDHTVSGTGAVVMNSGNVWSQYVSQNYNSTNSGWDVSTGLFTAPVAGRYCFTLAYQLSSHSSGYFYTYLQHNGVTKTYQYSPQTTNQIPIAQNAIFNMAANDTARVVYLTNYVSGIISLVSFSGHLIG